MSKKKIHTIVEPDPPQHLDSEPRIRTCFNPGCLETLSYNANGQAVTQDFVDAINSWVTLTSECLSERGHDVICRTYCSIDCLRQAIDRATPSLIITPDSRDN